MNILFLFLLCPESNMNGHLKWKCKGDAGWSECMTFLYLPLTLGRWVSSIIKTTIIFNMRLITRGCWMTPCKAPTTFDSHWSQLLYLQQKLRVFRSSWQSILRRQKQHQRPDTREPLKSCPSQKDWTIYILSLPVFYQGWFWYIPPR